MYPRTDTIATGIACASNTNVFDRVSTWYEFVRNKRLNTRAFRVFPFLRNTNAQ